MLTPVYPIHLLGLLRFGRLKLPAFALHKIFERHAGNVEVLADIRNFDGVRPDLLHCHDSTLRNKGLGDDERVGMTAALQKFPLLDALLEARYRENARDKSALFGRWRCENFLVSRRPITKGFYRAFADLFEDLAD